MSFNASVSHLSCVCSILTRGFVSLSIDCYCMLFDILLYVTMCAYWGSIKLLLPLLLHMFVYMTYTEIDSLPSGTPAFMQSADRNR